MGDFVGTIIGATGQVFAGAAAQSELKASAKQSELEARQELIIGEADALEIERELNEALASSIASAGARGVSVGGSGAAAAAELIREASFAQRISTLTAEVGAGQKRVEAARFREAGSKALVAGFLQAGGTVGQQLTRTKARGSTTT